MVKAVRPTELDLPEMPTAVAPAEEVSVAGSNIPKGPTHTVEVKLYKPHPTTKLGVTLTSTGMEAPAVTALAPDGAAQASLQLGDVVLSVNGSAGKGHEETTELLRAGLGEIAILVQRKGVKSLQPHTTPSVASTQASSQAPVAPVAPPASDAVPVASAVPMASAVPVVASWVPVGVAGAAGASGREPPPPSFDRALAMEMQAMQQLQAMGFDESQASEALKRSGGSVEVAAELLTRPGQ